MALLAIPRDVAHVVSTGSVDKIRIQGVLFDLGERSGAVVVRDVVCDEAEPRSVVRIVDAFRVVARVVVKQRVPAPRSWTGTVLAVQTVPESSTKLTSEWRVVTISSEWSRIIRQRVVPRDGRRQARDWRERHAGGRCEARRPHRRQHRQ